jgi:hypothetical protein
LLKPVPIVSLYLISQTIEMRSLLIVFYLVALGFTSPAQNKIAIVNNADSNLYFEYVAFTIFGNSENVIPCNFNSPAYAEGLLTSVLAKKYEVTKINLPPELQKYKGGTGLKKWVKSLNGKYDKVLLLTSMTMTDYAHNTNAALIGSGLYSRMTSFCEVYSTIYYKIYNTADGKNESGSMPGFRRVEGYTYSETHNQFNLAMCDFVVRELKEFIKEQIPGGLVVGGLFTKDELFVLQYCDTLKPTPQINLAYENNIRDSVLTTGWYYVTEKSKGFERKLDKSDETFYLNPMPIAVQDNFSSVEMYETNFSGSRPDYAGLTIVLDDYGRKAFALATYNSYDGHVALVINNKLVSAPLVKTIVTDAFTFLRRGEYSLSDVKAFVNEMGVTGL